MTGNGKSKTTCNYHKRKKSALGIMHRDKKLRDKVEIEESI